MTAPARKYEIETTLAIEDYPHRDWPMDMTTHMLMWYSDLPDEPPGPSDQPLVVAVKHPSAAFPGYSSDFACSFDLRNGTFTRRGNYALACYVMLTAEHQGYQLPAGQVQAVLMQFPEYRAALRRMDEGRAMSLFHGTPYQGEMADYYP